MLKYNIIKNKYININNIYRYNSNFKKICINNNNKIAIIDDTKTLTYKQVR